MIDETMLDHFTEDYYLRGKESGLSNYENYSWRPHLTIPVCKLIMHYLGAQRGDRVLDYGCARGYYVKALRGLGYDAWGCDVSQWAITNCDPEIKTCVSTSILSNLLWVNYVLAKDVLEHIELEKLGSVLRLFIEITHKAALIIVPLASDRAEGRFYVSPIDQSDSTHKIAWTLDEWLTFIQATIDASGRAFTISGSYKMPGVKRAADPWPKSCGFFLLKRFEYE